MDGARYTDPVILWKPKYSNTQEVCGLFNLWRSTQEIKLVLGELGI